MVAPNVKTHLKKGGRRPPSKMTKVTFNDKRESNCSTARGSTKVAPNVKVHSKQLAEDHLLK